MSAIFGLKKSVFGAAAAGVAVLGLGLGFALSGGVSADDGYAQSNGGPGERDEEVAYRTEGNATTSTTANSTAATTVPPGTRIPGEVQVQVLNSNAPNGSAKRATTTLSTSGYPALSPRDSRGPRVTATEIYFQAGYEGDATAIATHLGLPAAVQPMPPTPPPPASVETNVVVVLGPDFAVPASDTTKGDDG